MSVTKMHGFVKLNSTESKKSFYAKLYKNHWWMDGLNKNHDTDWTDVFQQGDWACVYCNHDLITSTDVLASSTEEHLVPRSLLEANDKSTNHLDNLAPCCPSCNGLKNEYIPDHDNPCWETRNEFIKECKRFITCRRSDNFKKYHHHIKKVIENRSTACANCI